MVKKFNKDLHREHDTRAKLAYVEWAIDNFGARVIIDPHGEYDVDLKIEIPNGVEFYVEVEVRELWKQNEFPFTSIHIPYRKGKYLEYSHPVVFVSFRSDLKKFVAIFSKDVKEVVELTNKFSKVPEKFYDILVSKGLRIDL